MNWLLNSFRWRATRSRVRRQATALIHAHGERAFFRAHEAVWIALGLSERAQAKYWEAVACEIARQLRRGVVLASIMQPRATTPQQLRGKSESTPVSGVAASPWKQAT